MKKIHYKIALFIIWIVIMLPIVEAQLMSLQDPAGDATPPSISTVQLTHGPQTVVTWATDEAANSKVDFGPTTELNQTSTKPDLETAHSLTIQTTPGATYYYKITSCDAVGNCKGTTVDNFIAGPFYVKANVPRYAKTTKLDLTGSTRPGATVSVIVNGAEVRKDQIDDGEFLFKNIQLLKAANTIQLKATLGAESAEANYQIDIDDQPPIMNVTLPAVVTAATATAKVRVSEPVNLTVELAKPTGDKPLRPTELKDDKVAANRVDLTWKAVTPILEYGIYRNNKRIATSTSPQYSDTTVGAGKQYQYQVSAANDKCIESDLSDIVTVNTPTGTNTEQPAQEKPFSCEKPKQVLSFEGQKDIQVQLQEGENFVTFTAVDKAGYKSIAEERVLYDTGPPKFLENNLKQLSPTYSQEVTARGKLSERGTVTAFVNGKPQKTEPTAEDGTFSVKIKLERTINYTAEQTRTSLDAGISWKSKVKLEATDAAGLTASSEEVQMEYALCGSGTWINVQLTDPMPDILNPRLLIEGIQQIGIAFNYEYKGGYSAVINPRDIRVKKLNLAPEFQKLYDNGLVTTYTPPVRAQRGKKPTGAGYIQINFQPIEDPWALAEKDKDPNEKAPANATMYTKEERISNHRIGDCLLPGFGCMRLFLELEIPFQEETEQLGYLPEQRGGTIEQKKLTNKVQRTCVNIEVAIDKRIPPDYIPSGFLRTMSDFLTAAIDTIDKVIKPIETIGKYLFFTCVAGTFLSFVPIFLEKYNCEYKKYEQMLGGQGKFDPKVAEIGLCEKEYSGDSEKMQNCMSCQDWKDRRKSFERTYRQICDRVMCPAAPSLQFYLKTRGRQKPTPVDAKTAQQNIDKGYVVDGKLFSGSDCAAWLIDRQINVEEREKKAQAEMLRARQQRLIIPTGQEKSPATIIPTGPAKSPVLAAIMDTGITGAQTTQPQQQRTQVRIPPRLYFTNEEIRGLYHDWLEHKDDDENTEGLNCAGLHPATPKCCGYEYMQEWSSACGVSALGSGLDTFDEIKESACLSEQKANSNEIPGFGGEAATKCKGIGSILNIFSGFCGENNQPRPETIRIVPFEGGPEKKDSMQDKLQLAATKDKYMYLLMIPREGGTDYDLKLGYIYETVEFEKSGQTKPDASRHTVTSKVEGIELDEKPPTMQETYFSPDAIQKYYQNQHGPVFYANFQDYLCKQAGYGSGGKCGANGRSIYDQVMAHIGQPDKEYIIKPNEGLINSIRCLCFPTIIGYLKLWRKIMAEVRNCVNTILLTGDGESGICQAIISRYVCDLLYEVLACFTQNFSSGQSRAEGGDIMGALTAAGTEMSRSVESRYGETGMYKAVFVDRKIVHSICMFAFTGTWNFDLATVFDQSVDEIPLESQALMMPCNRRFVAFNPSTRPGGLVTWVYHFGVFVAAGADIDLELHLVCSGGYNCKESEGFENGKCDCVAPRDVVILPQELPTRVKKSDILSQEVFFTMTAGTPESQIRYDKAYLKYTYKEGQTKVTPGQTDPCSIGQTGGAGAIPAFCRFDPLGQSFRCMFGEAEGAIRFQPPPGFAVNYPHKITRAATEVFAVKDNLNIDLKIQQDYPGQESQAKHLQYELFNSAGQVVETNKDKGLILLTTSGDYTKPIGPSTSPATIVIRSEWFQAGTGAGQARVEEWYSGTGQPGSIAGPAARPVVERSSIRVVEQGVQTTGQYVLVLSSEAGAPVYSIFKGTTPNAVPTAGYPKTGDRVCSGALPPAFSTITCQDAGKTLTVQITDARPQVDKRDRYEVYIGFGLIPGASPCTGADRVKPQSFKIKFTAFDSDRYGQPTEQVTLDPITGQEGILEVPLSIVCANNDDADFKRVKDEAEGILPPSEVVGRLAAVIKSMLDQENNDKRQIEGFATGSDRLDLRPTEVAGFFDTITAHELQHAGQLQEYVIKLKSVTGDLLQLKQPVTDLYNKLRLLNETEVEDPSLNAKNIVYQSGEAKKKILGPPAQSDAQIRAILQSFLLIFNPVIAEKEELIKKIPAIVKITTPCPPSPGVLEKADESYYMCSESNLTKTNAVWQFVAERPCHTTTEQKCYKLPKDSNCAGVTDKETNFNCQPTQADIQKSCTGGYTPYPPPGSSEKPRVCPQTGQTCCRKTIRGLDKLMDLKKFIKDLQRYEIEDAKNLETWKFPTNDERVLEQMNSTGGRTPPLVSNIGAIITKENLLKSDLERTLSTYTADNIAIPDEVYTITRGGEIDHPVYDEFTGEQIRTDIERVPGIPDVVKNLENINRDLSTNAKPTASFIRAKINEAQSAIVVLDKLKRRAIEGINRELGLNTCQVGYNSDKFTYAIGDKTETEDRIFDVQICSTTDPGEPWKEIQNAPCSGPGEKCYSGQPKILYKTGTEAFQELLTTKHVKFQKGEQATFAAKIPVVQPADIPSPQLKLGGTSLTATKTTGPNHILIEATTKIETPTYVGVEYMIGGKKGILSASYEIPCPSTAIEGKEYQCSTTFCNTAAKETWEPYTCPSETARFCCSKAPTAAAPAGPTKKTIQLPVFLGDITENNVPGCTPPAGLVEYVGKGIFKDNDNAWGVSAESPTVPKDKHKWLQLCIAKELQDKIQLKANGCRTDWVSKGWFVNEFDGWACITGGACEKSGVKVHLCVKSSAETDAGGEFAYIGVKDQLLVQFYTNGKCKPGFTEQGHFTFRNGPSDEFAYGYHNKETPQGVLLGWQQVNGYYNGITNRIMLCVKQAEVTIGPEAPATSGGLFGGLSTGTKITIAQEDNFAKNVKEGRIYSSTETPSTPFYVIKLLAPSGLSTAVCNAQKRVKVQIWYYHELCKEADLDVGQQITISPSDCSGNSDPGTLELTSCVGAPRLWEFTVKQ